MIDRVCDACGKTFSVSASTLKRYPARACSPACAGKLRAVRANVPAIGDLSGRGVYTITHLPSGLVYVGSSVDVKSRWHYHSSRLGRGIHEIARLQDAVARDGIDALRMQIVERVPQGGISALRAAENRWIAKLDTRNPSRGFNSKGVTIDVQDVFRRAADGEMLKDIAADYRVDISRICAIVNRRESADVEIPDDVLQRLHSYRATALSTRGARHAKLTPAQVREIRIRRLAGETLKQIGAAYNVSIATVSDILHGRSWAHLR